MDADSTENNNGAESINVNRVHIYVLLSILMYIYCDSNSVTHPNVQPNNQLVLSHTPNRSELWISVVESKFRPTIGTVFSSLEARIEFYGKLHYSPVHEHNIGDSSSTIETIKRRDKISRIGCRAYVRFSLLNGLEGPAILNNFSEVHNHHLTSVCYRDLETIWKSLDMFHKQLILDNSKLKIGSGKTFRQVKELVHRYQNIGATLVDFKNFQRYVKCYIRKRDADLFLDRLKKLKATQNQFYFAYDVGACNCLTRVFWADSTSIRNYSFLGDAVSLDPTYGTNKYDMVFTPFTGVNHHRKSVFFAACLLLHEDDESFKWTFQHFLNAMGQKETQFLITDQCPSIKKASPSVFKQARHHYCMWHITQKITYKVGSALSKDSDFLTRFNAVV
ncbi:protein FAR1-RELATED SEQUENCE 5-like [Silene latifolia]|uniref:protein FAR1-RELATED SEQUENCE 5-like n=1 Tax=Silene latifolia TaxID=37657 RepID=UPI003D780BAD